MYAYHVPNCACLCCFVACACIFKSVAGLLVGRALDGHPITAHHWYAFMKGLAVWRLTQSNPKPKPNHVVGAGSMIKAVGV